LISATAVRQAPPTMDPTRLRAAQALMPGVKPLFRAPAARASPRLPNCGWR